MKLFYDFHYQSARTNETPIEKPERVENAEQGCWKFSFALFVELVNTSFHML